MMYSPKAILRTAILAACTATLGATVMVAQDGPPPPREGRGGPAMQAQMLDRMTKELSLTPDQVTQIKAIQDDSRKQIMALREDTSTTGPDRRTKMMAMREAEQTRIKAVLTDAQKVKYDAMLEKMKENREQRRDDSGTPPPPPPSL